MSVEVDGDRESERGQLLAGAALVAAAGLLFAFAGVAIRIAGATLSSIEILFWRNAISMLILTPWVVLRWPESIRPAHAGLMVMRGATVVVSLICYYYAVTVIPLAEAVLLNFSAPIFVPILGFLLFRFPFNRTVLVAVAIGFVGAALILKPGTDLFQPAALIGLAAGVLGALAIVAVWRMPASENATRIAVYFALIGIVITAGPVLMTPRLPPTEAWPALVMLGGLSTAAHVLFARGCLIAPADRVSILNYTSVFFAAALAWLLWDERVDWFMVAGTALIVVASFIAVRAGGNGSRNNPRFHTRRGGTTMHLGADK